jgi:glutaredoxin
MAKKYKITVYGKTGCDKCKVLNQRLDNLLEKDEWQDFEKSYLNIETEEGIVSFCKAECINPQRIPAFVVEEQHPEKQRYVPLRNPRPGQSDEVCKKTRLHHIMGLQTDYSDQGRGVISPKMIKRVLEEARQV